VMRIAVPHEIKNHEHRVALLPAGGAALVADGHQVLVQAGAGRDSGFSDHTYQQAGACVTDSAADCWAADLVIKVKEPLAEEYDFLRPGLMLFTFLHLAAVPALLRVLLDKKVCAIAYETVQLDDGTLPLLAGMSQVAGRVAAQLAVRFLQKENGTPFAGLGRLAAGIAGSAPAQVLIFGAGNVGLHAADALAGLGAEVVLLEANADRMKQVESRFESRFELQTETPTESQTEAPRRPQVLAFLDANIRRLLPHCDILIGAALIPGQHAPGLLKRSDVHTMQAGSVFIDVSIDQGGISETSRVTSYDDPVYVEAGVIHCCLPNLPGAVPLTSTMALTHASLPYIRLLADHGFRQAMALNQALSRGLNVCDGLVVHQGLMADCNE
ncbi:MAG: alanine dehydrogenase, partial [Mariprofundus sp.]|nr:alanine dehydrogenase [Mariprofundus sp.]